jgi:hypothetical protein
MDAPRFVLGDGPDKLFLEYAPESILTLARIIEAARRLDMPGADSDVLVTVLRGRLALPAPA